MLRSLFAALLALALALPGSADAQTKVTKLVVAFPPGGPVDIVARLIADPMSKELGHTVIVENKPGGNTFIAAEMVARAQPDGSVIFLSSMSTVVLNTLLYKDMPYDPAKDFAPVSLVVSSPTIMVVNAANPANDVAAFVAASKAAAKPLPFSSAGVGGTTHIAIELFIDASGAKVLHSPFKGRRQRLGLLAFLYGCGDLRVNTLLHNVVKVSVLLLKAFLAQFIDKGNGFRKTLHLFMVLDNQAALGVAQTLPVLLGLGAPLVARAPGLAGPR